MTTALNILICIVSLGFCANLAQKPIRPTRLLPNDGSIIHCAGQVNQDLNDPSFGSFNNYTNYLVSGTKPSTFMIYFGLPFTSVADTNTWFKQLNGIINKYPSSTWYAIQFGLDFHNNPNNDADNNDNVGDYGCDIGDGKYDDNIKAMISGFNLLGRPVYLRIGYEFNGQWNNYGQQCYIEAYQHITKMLRADTFCNKYVATVWDYTADSEYVGKWIPWYPGDEYVDWWGVNVFGLFNTPGTPNSNAGVGSPWVTQFMQAAVNRSYPILIGESTPRQVGGDSMPNGCAYSKSWNDFYIPYFSMITNVSYNIRAFCYINWDWWSNQNGVVPPMNWGQAEINFADCDNMNKNYQSYLSNNKKTYLNAMDEASMKKVLGL